MTRKNSNPGRWWAPGILIALAAVVAGATSGIRAQESKTPTIRAVAGTGTVPKAFEVVGLTEARLKELTSIKADDERWARTLAVYVVDASAKGEPVAMLGSCAVEGQALRFTPRYPLRAGTAYRVVFRPAGKESEVTQDVQVPESTAPRAQVTEVYPTAAVLPENLLKFYVYFSAPMSQGEAYDRVRILNADGKPVESPFLEIGEELWDGSGQRLMLLIHPGRIKRGLKPIEDSGPVLEAGRKYTLVIDAAWRDAEGRAMPQGFRKSFETGAAIRTAVETADWKVTSPAAGGKDPLVLRFPRSMDRALLDSALDVVDARNARVEGRVVVADEERRWEFHPEKAWTAGRHQLVIETILEDLSGNRVGRPFEIEPSQQALKNQPKTVRLPFTVTGR